MDNRRSPTQARIIHTRPAPGDSRAVVGGGGGGEGSGGGGGGASGGGSCGVGYGYSSVNFICRPQNNL